MIHSRSFFFSSDSYLYTNEAVRIINSHNASQPLFLYLPFQVTHNPLEAPAEYIHPVPQDPRRWHWETQFFFFPRKGKACLSLSPVAKTFLFLNGLGLLQEGVRAKMNAMVTMLDQGVQNVTEALKANNLWDNTLVVFSAGM